MLFSSLIKLFSSLKKSYDTLLDISSFLRKNKIISPSVGIIIIVVIISLWNLSVLIGSRNNSHFLSTKIKNDIAEKIDDSLRKCKGRVSISIGVVSLDKVRDRDYWSGLPYLIRVCDSDFSDRNSKECNILDLISISSIYRSETIVDIGSYEFLTKIGNDPIPQFFSLRTDGKQDIGSTTYIPVIYNYLIKTNWYSREILQSMWTTSVLSFDKKVLYTVTLLNASDNGTLKCDNPNLVLEDIKQFIISKIQ